MTHAAPETAGTAEPPSFFRPGAFLPSLDSAPPVPDLRASFSRSVIP